MTVPTDEEYGDLGRAVAHLSQISVRTTAVNAIPPAGAGRLITAGDTEFVWEPIPEALWQSLTDIERGRIVADRAVGWLERNAELITAPLSFVEDPDEQVNRAFGINAHNVHEALCATYRMLEKHDEGVEYALVVFAGIATISAGAHGAVLGLHAVTAIIKSYGRRRCV